MTSLGQRAPRRRRPRGRHAAEVDAFLERITADPASPALPYVAELVDTAVSLLEEATLLGDVKLINASTRELRYALRVFEPWRGVRKVTAFGSARTPEDHPTYLQAKEFARRVTDNGFMLITGAGPGIMQACQEGAGRERSFGLNIRLPFEQGANPFIAGDRKLVTFRYFFTRKLMFLKEADALVLFPGGFGTYDETYECLTLIQTGKAPLIPVVMIDRPGGQHWAEWLDYVETHLLAEGLISEDDLHLVHVTEDVDDAVREVTRFYRLYHSSRFVGDRLVLRLTENPAPGVIDGIRTRFRDIVATGDFELSAALPEEEDGDLADLPRLVFHFDRTHYGRLRQLIDFLNESAG